MKNNNKKYLVTGGAGFVGSNLCRKLIQNSDSTIYSLDNYSTGNKNNHISGIYYIEGETANVQNLIKFQPDVIFHLGEYSRVEQSFEDINKVIFYNISGTSAILEFARNNKSKLIYAGSSTKFSHGNDKNLVSPYSWTKAANTELVKKYGEWFGLDYAITYFYNVYGMNEISEGKYATLIEIFKKQMQKKQPLTVVKPGTQERNFTHVDDIVSGLILVGEKGKGDGYGIGSQETYTINEVAKLFGGPLTYLEHRKGNRSGADLLIDKTIKLGWKQKFYLEDYINELKKNNWDKI